MSFTVRLHAQAQEDLDCILGFIAQRSPEGAKTWYRRWEEVIQQLQVGADKFLLAPESAGRKRDIRQVIFKTRRGREYRALFSLVNQTVVVLHLRGPGQNLLDPDEIREP